MSGNFTNFAQLTDEQKTVWRMRVWRAARNKAFVGKFLGTTDDSMIQRITELKRSEKGHRAVITLVHDLEGDGTAGDRFLEGNEEEMKSSDQVITIDQLRHAVRSAGKMADQRSVVQFRNSGENNLSYWLAERVDQMAFLTMSGIDYAFNTNGAARTGSDLPYLDFASDVSAPTTNRHFQWDQGTGDLIAPDHANLAAADTPSYAMMVELKALAEDKYIKPLRMNGGVAWYNVFMTPQGVAKLKLDEDFKRAYREALPRTPDSPIFKGTDVIWLDGLAIHSFRNVYNTRGTTAWGGGLVHGQRVLLCGAQALAMADLGLPTWVEKEFDFDNQPAIALAKILGMLKPKFHSIYDGTTEDFSILSIDTAI